MSEARARAAGKPLEPTKPVVVSSSLLKFKMADGDSATNVLKIAVCAKGVLAPVHLFFFLLSNTNPKYKSFYVIFSDSKTVVLR